MDTYIQLLKAHFSAQAVPEIALPMKKYMRNQFDFLGIKAPQITCLHKQFIEQHGWPDSSQLSSLTKTLWQWPEREYQYLALRFVDHFISQLTPSDLPMLEWLLLNKSWWDTVDSIAIHPVGDLFSRFPIECEPYLEKWRSHENIWLRRTTLLFQLAYKHKTDEALLFSLIKENLGSQEFFINKAIGWALREYSKTAPEAVEQYVKETELASLSHREALKWIKKKAKGRG